MREEYSKNILSFHSIPSSQAKPQSLWFLFLKVQFFSIFKHTHPNSLLSFYVTAGFLYWWVSELKRSDLRSKRERDEGGESYQEERQDNRNLKDLVGIKPNLRGGKLNLPFYFLVESWEKYRNVLLWIGLGLASSWDP